MAKAPKKKEEAQVRAAELAERLALIKPDDLTERQWCIQAGVSSSFFSNLRGTPTKPPSEPSIGNLREILRIADITLPAFFADEAQGRLVLAPSEQALEEAFRDALPLMPKTGDRRAKYLVEVVGRLLRLPEDRLSIHANEDGPGGGDRGEGTPLRATTK